MTVWVEGEGGAGALDGLREELGVGVGRGGGALGVEGWMKRVGKSDRVESCFGWLLVRS